MKILLADDEIDILESMGKKIKREGYDVVLARDGEEAWEKAVAESPDILIMDITMPKMTGLDVLNKLRTSPPHKKWQPVIIVSALGELSDIHKGMDLEADHYLVKPCSIDDIIKAVRLMANLIPQRLD